MTPAEELHTAADKLRALATAAATGLSAEPTIQWAFTERQHDSGEGGGSGMLRATTAQLPHRKRDIRSARDRIVRTMMISRFQPNMKFRPVPDLTHPVVGRQDVPCQTTKGAGMPREDGSDDEFMSDDQSMSDDDYVPDENELKRSRSESEDEDDGPARKRSRTSSGDDSDKEFEALVGSFVAQAVSWCKANGARIQGAYGSGVGWEIWLEVELYIWLTKNAPTLKASRQTPYTLKGQQRGDLLIGNKVIIELKVETHKETGQAFAKRVDNDMKKVDRGSGNRPAVVVAFAVSQDGIDEVKKLAVGDGVDASSVRIFWEATS